MIQTIAEAMELNNSLIVDVLTASDKSRQIETFLFDLEEFYVDMFGEGSEKQLQVERATELAGEMVTNMALTHQRTAYLLTALLSLAK